MGGTKHRICGKASSLINDGTEGMGKSISPFPMLNNDGG